MSIKQILIKLGRKVMSLMYFKCLISHMTVKWDVKASSKRNTLPWELIQYKKLFDINERKPVVLSETLEML